MQLWYETGVLLMCGACYTLRQNAVSTYACQVLCRCLFPQPTLWNRNRHEAHRPYAKSAADRSIGTDRFITKGLLIVVTGLLMW